MWNRDAKRRGIYLALFTDSEGDSCFSIYQISWIEMKKVTFCKLKTSLSSNFVTIYKHFGDFVKCIFTILLQIQHENSFLHTSKQWQAKVRRFLGNCLCECFTFIAQISSFENVSKRDVILAPVAKQWIAKDIPRYGSQSERAKIAIHRFGKYEKAEQNRCLELGVLPKFHSKNFLKILQEYPSVDEIKGKKRLHGV